VLIRLERISGLLAKLAADFSAIVLIEWSDWNFWVMDSYGTTHHRQA